MLHVIHIIIDSLITHLEYWRIPLAQIYLVSILRFYLDLFTLGHVFRHERTDVHFARAEFLHFRLLIYKRHPWMIHCCHRSCLLRWSVGFDFWLDLDWFHHIIRIWNVAIAFCANWSFHFIVGYFLLLTSDFTLFIFLFLLFLGFLNFLGFLRLLCFPFIPFLDRIILENRVYKSKLILLLWNYLMELWSNLESPF